MGHPSDCFTASVHCWTRSDPHHWPTRFYHKDFASSEGQWQPVVAGGLFSPILGSLPPASLLNP